MLRPLSDRERSKLFLARTEGGALVALKLELPRPPAITETIIRRYTRLQELTGSVEGWARILDFGELGSGWVWHSMPLADNLPGLPPVASEPDLLHYTPLTLAAWTIENGPAEILQVARWGQRLCRALGELHRAGLVHRDVKPTNLLFIQGQLSLADYGLVGEPGSEFDLSGTEGFIPLEGTSDPAADLFALGKALYQAWSGKDRLEFPSLPVILTGGTAWKRYGTRLNDVILRACHAQPSRRFHSAEEFSQALADVLEGRKRGSRRWWFATVGTAAAAAAAASLFRRSRPVATAVWRRVGRAFNLEAWHGHFGTVDWSRRRIYSLSRELSSFLLHSVDLDSFRVKTKSLEPLPQDLVESILQPASGNLLAVEGGLGEVYEIDVDTGQVKPLGGGPCSRKHFGAALYWNPLTGRLGTFGGYGYFKVNNSRHEFDPELRNWIQLTNQPPGHLPWPRHGSKAFFRGPDSTRLFISGGNGSPAAEQGQEVRGLRGFNGRFHFLDDIWELDLRNDRWTELLPNGLFPMPPGDPTARSAFYHPVLKAIIVLIPADLGGAAPTRTTMWLVRPECDRRPLPLAMEGEVSRLGQAWAYTLDPRTKELLLLGADGIYRVSFQ